MGFGSPRWSEPCCVVCFLATQYGGGFVPSRHDHTAKYSKRKQKIAVKTLDVARPPPEKDLTVEGIEPNPGPTPKVKKAVNTAKRAAQKEVKHLVKNVVKHATRSKNKEPSVARRTLRAGAGALGSLVGLRGPAEAASDFISDVFGFGAYHVKRNSLATSSDQVPEFKSDREGSVRFQHREMITDVVGSVAFSNAYVGQISPTNAAMFPWLSRIATNYEEYKFHGLLFMFKSTSADALNSTNTALGTVLMATQYDAADVPFNDKQTLEAYEFATSTKPSRSVIHPVECAPSADVITKRYVRNTMNSQNQGLMPTANITGMVAYGDQTLQTNVNFTDVGVFQLSTVGMQAAATIGELWVIYDVELLMPRLTPTSPNCVTTWYSNRPVNSPVAVGGQMFSNMQNVTNLSNNTLAQLGYPQLGVTDTFSYIAFPQCTPKSIWNVHVLAAAAVAPATLSYPSPSFYNCSMVGTAFPEHGGGAASYFFSAGTNNATWQFSVVLGEDTARSVPMVTIPPISIAGGGTLIFDVRIYRQPYVPGLIAPQLNLTTDEEQAARIKALIFGKKASLSPLPDPPCGPDAPIAPGTAPAPLPTVEEVKECTTPFEDLEASIHIRPQELKALKDALGGLGK